MQLKMDSARQICNNIIMRGEFFRREYFKQFFKGALAVCCTGCVQQGTTNDTPNSGTRSETISPSPKPLPYHSFNASNNNQFPEPAGIEKYIHRLTNASREKHGYNSIRWNDNLAYIARYHSKDMEKRDYFSHIDPDGEGPRERVKEYDLPYWNSFENIAVTGATEGKSPEELAEDIFEMWITSEKGHRENILAENVDHEGVGVFLPEDGGIYATQLFGELPGHE